MGIVNKVKRGMMGCLLLGAQVVCPAAERDWAALWRSLPFEMEAVERPAIPAREVRLTDFGGVGDGTTLNTTAFREAIRNLSGQGGGRLVVPGGVWLTGPIELDDNIELHLEGNAVIRFSRDRALYPIVQTLFEGRDTWRCQPMLSAVGKHCVAVTGCGVIDGGGDGWRAVHKADTAPGAWENYLRQGGVTSADGQWWYPSESYARGAKDAVQNQVPWAKTMEDFESVRDFLRPVLAHFRSCDGLWLQGVVFQNSPCWNVHLALCTRVLAEGIAVRCPWNAKNGDGIDIESCSDMVLADSWFDAGDDAICIKSGKDAEGRKRGVPASRIVVTGCTCYHGHGGFTVGSEMSGGARDILVSDCLFSGTDVGLRFKSRRGRGGTVRDIYIRDIRMHDIAQEALLFDLFYQQSSSATVEEDMPPVAVDEGTPQFRDIHISRVTCHNAGAALLLNGLPEMPVQNVTVEQSQIQSRTGARINESSGVQLRHLTLTPAEGPALLLHNVQGLRVEGLQCSVSNGPSLSVTGSRNARITVRSSNLSESCSRIAEPARGSVTFSDAPMGADFTVSPDGSAQFRTVGEAIRAVPDFCGSETVIYLHEGVYAEKLNIPSSKKNLRLLGKPGGHTVITWHDSARHAGPTGIPLGTPGAATVVNASDRFVAENITFENTSGPTDGQGVALLCMGDRQQYLHCHIRGNHDTLFLYGVGNLPERDSCTQVRRYLFEGCLIEGTTDFIFGSATAWLHDCIILSKKNSYITAASTPRGQAYGFVFDHCRLEAAEGVTRVQLGRPWRIHAQTVFLHCQMGAHISPEGWYDWKKPAVHTGTALYAEYANEGAGATTEGRVDWSRQLTQAEAARYTREAVWGVE